MAAKKKPAKRIKRTENCMFCGKFLEKETRGEKVGERMNVYLCNGFLMVNGQKVTHKVMAWERIPPPPPPPPPKPKAKRKKKKKTKK